MRVKAKFESRAAVMARLRSLVPEAEKELAKAQLEGAQELASRIRARAPGKGRYRSTIQGDRLANRKGTDRNVVGLSNETKDENATGVFADWRWRFLEFGTKAHIINPKNGEFLVFRGKGGKIVATKRVRHPGTVRHPHIFPTYREYRKQLRRKMANAVNKAVRKVRKGL
jgi:hypothetical protein